jgi:hypothetical protein
MIKGVRIGGTGRALSYLDTLVIPIIDNTPDEEDLKDSMAEVRNLLSLYPNPRMSFPAHRAASDRQ